MPVAKPAVRVVGYLPEIRQKLAGNSAEGRTREVMLKR